VTLVTSSSSKNSTRGTENMSFMTFLFTPRCRKRKWSHVSLGLLLLSLFLFLLINMSHAQEDDESNPPTFAAPTSVQQNAPSASPAIASIEPSNAPSVDQVIGMSSPGTIVCPFDAIFYVSHSCTHAYKSAIHTHTVAKPHLLPHSGEGSLAPSNQPLPAEGMPCFFA
jgi:hypothetical protein